MQGPVAQNGERPEQVGGLAEMHQKVSPYGSSGYGGPGGGGATLSQVQTYVDNVHRRQREAADVPPPGRGGGDYREHYHVDHDPGPPGRGAGGPRDRDSSTGDYREQYGDYRDVVRNDGPTRGDSARPGGGQYRGRGEGESVRGDHNDHEVRASMAEMDSLIAQADAVNQHRGPRELDLMLLEMKQKTGDLTQAKVKIPIVIPQNFAQQKFIDLVAKYAARVGHAFESQLKDDLEKKKVSSAR